MPHLNKSNSALFSYSPSLSDNNKINKTTRQQMSFIQTNESFFNLNSVSKNAVDYVEDGGVPTIELSDHIDDELGDSNTVDELSELDLKDLGEYLIDKEEIFTNSASLFAKTVNSTESINISLSALAVVTDVVPEAGRKAEELANADKELDRLLSLARQNDVKEKNNVISPDAKHHETTKCRPFSFDMLEPLKLPTMSFTFCSDLNTTSTVQVFIFFC